MRNASFHSFYSFGGGFSARLVCIAMMNIFAVIIVFSETTANITLRITFAITQRL